jgi:hypothetical protein
MLFLSVGPKPAISRRKEADELARKVSSPRGMITWKVWKPRHVRNLDSGDDDVVTKAPSDC